MLGQRHSFITKSASPTRSGAVRPKMKKANVENLPGSLGIGADERPCPTVWHQPKIPTLADCPKVRQFIDRGAGKFVLSFDKETGEESGPGVTHENGSGENSFNLIVKHKKYYLYPCLIKYSIY